MSRKDKEFKEYVFIFNDSDDVWKQKVEDSEKKDEQSGWFS